MVQSGTRATIFGNATVNGIAATYRLDVDDVAEPGVNRDVFALQTSSSHAGQFRCTGRSTDRRERTGLKTMFSGPFSLEPG